MPDVRRRQVESVLGRSLLAAENLTSEFRDQLVRRLAEERLLVSQGSLVRLAGLLLDDFTPLYAQAIAEADMAAWVAGANLVVGKLPKLAQTAIGAGGGGPSGPRGSLLAAFGGGGDDEPIIRFPLIERAASRLLEADIVTRSEFDELASDARARAFTVAREANLETLGRIRDVLGETIREGPSLRKFREKLGEDLERSFIGPGHLENVYRTNIQARFHQGHDELASNPVAAEVFPYQEYLAIRDGRVRPEHLKLEELGLSGTAVYRRDDPFWDLFTPPWDYQCRCGVNLLTVEAAAKKGVVEARKWLRTGNPPDRPEWRIDKIPFRPPPDFVGGRAA